MSLSGVMFSFFSGRSDKKRDQNLKAPEDVEAVYDINYAGNNDEYNLLDVYFKKGTEGKLPVIVSIHGGGYVYGTKIIYKYYGMYLAEQGFTFVNFNYHLAPGRKFPTQLVETNMVMKWMTKNAEKYHLDLNNVFMVGDSAGAQMLSQYAAIATNQEYADLFKIEVPSEIKLRAIALNCGMYVPTIEQAKKDNNRMNIDLYTDLYGKDPESKYENFEQKTDVLGHITENYPPTYVMTAYYDFLKANAEPMYEFLKEKGIDTEWKCYGSEDKKYMAHVCHVNMNLEEAREINNDECAFFRKYLA